MRCSACRGCEKGSSFITGHISAQRSPVWSATCRKGADRPETTTRIEMSTCFSTNMYETRASLMVTWHSAAVAPLVVSTESRAHSSVGGRNIVVEAETGAPAGALKRPVAFLGSVKKSSHVKMSLLVTATVKLTVWKSKLRPARKGVWKLGRML